MKKTVLAFALLVAGIAAMNALDRDGKEAPPKLEPAEGWTLKSMTKEGAKVAGLAAREKRATLVVAGRKISGSGGCNSYDGKAKFRDGVMSLGAFGMTERACGDAAVMKQETMFVELFVKMNRYEFAGKDLILSDGTADNRLHFTSTMPEKAMSLTGTRWVLEGFEETDGEVDSFTAVAGKSKIDLRFGEDGKATGSGGVNLYFSSYKANLGKGTVEFAGVGSTRKGGPPELIRQEGEFFRKLKSMTRIEISGQKLTLADEKGGLSLLFKRAE